MAGFFETVASLIVVFSSLLASMALLYGIVYAYGRFITYTEPGRAFAKVAEKNWNSFFSFLMTILLLFLLYQFTLIIYNVVGHGLLGLEYIDSLIPSADVRRGLNEFFYRRDM